MYLGSSSFLRCGALCALVNGVIPYGMGKCHPKNETEKEKGWINCLKPLYLLVRSDVVFNDRA